MENNDSSLLETPIDSLTSQLRVSLTKFRDMYKESIDDVYRLCEKIDSKKCESHQSLDSGCDSQSVNELETLMGDFEEDRCLMQKTKSEEVLEKACKNNDVLRNLLQRRFAEIEADCLLIDKGKKCVQNNELFCKGSVKGKELTDERGSANVILGCSEDDVTRSLLSVSSDSTLNTEQSENLRLTASLPTLPVLVPNPINPNGSYLPYFLESSVSEPCIHPNLTDHDYEKHRQCRGSASGLPYSRYAEDRKKHSVDHMFQTLPCLMMNNYNREIETASLDSLKNRWRQAFMDRIQNFIEAGDLLDRISKCNAEYGEMFAILVEEYKDRLKLQDILKRISNMSYGESYSSKDRNPKSKSKNNGMFSKLTVPAQNSDVVEDIDPSSVRTDCDMTNLFSLQKSDNVKKTNSKIIIETDNPHYQTLKAKAAAGMANSRNKHASKTLVKDLDTENQLDPIKTVQRRFFARNLIATNNGSIEDRTQTLREVSVAGQVNSRGKTSTRTIMEKFDMEKQFDHKKLRTNVPARWLMNRASTNNQGACELEPIEERFENASQNSSFDDSYKAANDCDVVCGSPVKLMADSCVRPVEHSSVGEYNETEMGKALNKCITPRLQHRSPIAKPVQGERDDDSIVKALEKSLTHGLPNESKEIISNNQEASKSQSGSAIFDGMNQLKHVQKANSFEGSELTDLSVALPQERDKYPDVEEIRGENHSDIVYELQLFINKLIDQKRNLQEDKCVLDNALKILTMQEILQDNAEPLVVSRCSVAHEGQGPTQENDTSKVLDNKQPDFDLCQLEDNSFIQETVPISIGIRQSNEAVGKMVTDAETPFSYQEAADKETETDEIDLFSALEAYEKENESLQNVNKDLCETNDALRARIEFLMSEDEEMQTDMHNTSLRMLEEMDRQREENTVLRSNFNRVLKDNSYLENDLRNLEMSFDDLQISNEAISKKLHRKSEEYRIVKDQCVELKDDLKILQERLSRLEMTGDNSEKKFKSKQEWEEWTSLNEKLSATEKALYDARKQKSNVIQELGSMRVKFRESVDSLSRAEDAAAKLEKRLHRARLSNRLLIEENRKMREFFKVASVSPKVGRKRNNVTLAHNCMKDVPVDNLKAGAEKPCSSWDNVNSSKSVGDSTDKRNTVCCVSSLQDENYPFLSQQNDVPSDDDLEVHKTSRLKYSSVGTASETETISVIANESSVYSTTTPKCEDTFQYKCNLFKEAIRKSRSFQQNLISSTLRNENNVEHKAKMTQQLDVQVRGLDHCATQTSRSHDSPVCQRGFRQGHLELVKDHSQPTGSTTMHGAPSVLIKEDLEEFISSRRVDDCEGVDDSHSENFDSYEEEQGSDTIDSDDPITKIVNALGNNIDNSKTVKDKG